MDAIVPARASGTPFSGIARFDAALSALPLAARLLTRRKPSGRQDEHPP